MKNDFLNQINPATLKKLYSRKTFGKVFCNRIPYNAQMVMLRCTFPKVLVVTGRGTGKTQVIIGDNAIYRTSMKPIFDQIFYGLDKPLSAKTVIIGNVKDTAKMSQKNIRVGFEDSFLSQFVKKNTETYLETIHGSTVEIRTASAGARGIHALVELDKKTGIQINHPVYFFLDEFWFFEKRDFVQNVIEPALMHGGAGSQVMALTTPFGRDGAAWDIYSDVKTKECPQPYTTDPVTGIRTYNFDPRICQKCKSDNMGNWMRFTIESFQNTALTNAARRALLATKRRLLRNDRGIIWNQEYLGIPSETAGLFFNRSHIIKMTYLGDNVPELKFWNEQEIVAMDVKHGEWFIGVDPNSGVQKKGTDYASIAIVEKVGNRYLLRFLSRYRKGNMPNLFTEVNQLSLSGVNVFVTKFLKVVLKNKLRGTIRVGIDFGYGQAVMAALEPSVPSNVELDYVKNSWQSIADAFQTFKALIDSDQYKMPSLNWLETECKHLKVDADSDDDDVKKMLKIKKARGSHGDAKTVDGLFAIAYALAMTKEKVTEARAAVVNRKPNNIVGDQTSLILPSGDPRNISFHTPYNINTGD